MKRVLKVGPVLAGIVVVLVLLVSWISTSLAADPVESAISSDDTLVSAPVGVAPTLDGAATDPAWAFATSLTEPGTGATLKSVYNGGNVYFLATVPDTTASITKGAMKLGGTGTQAKATQVLAGTSVTSATVTAGGSGYTGAETCTVAAGAPTATCTLTTASGVVTGVNIINGGGGYTSVPAITIAGAPGTGATATANLTPTTVAAGDAATLSGGNGYTSVPSCTVTGGGGTGSTCTATIAAGAVATVTTTTGNSDYTSVPTITLGAPDLGLSATATAFLAKPGVGSGTATAPGAGYGSGTTCTLTTAPGQTGSGATCTAELTAGAVTGITITNPGTGYDLAPTCAITNGGGAGATCTTTLATTSVADVELVNGGSGYLSAPTVTIAGNATATSILTGDAVSGYTVTDGGSGYIYGAPPAVTISSWSTVPGQDEDRLNWMWSQATPDFTTSGCATKCHAGDDTAWLAAGTADLWHGKSARFLPVTSTGTVTAPTVDPVTHAITAGEVNFNGFSDDEWVGPNTPPTGGIYADTGDNAVQTNVVDGAPKYIETTGAVITIGGATGTGAVILPVVTAGGLTGATIISGGSGYPGAPTCNVTDNGSGGVGASCTATATAGVVTSVTVTGSGAGFGPVPTDFMDAMTLTQSEITAFEAALNSGRTAGERQADWDTYNALKAVVPNNILMDIGGSEGAAGPSGSRADIQVAANWKDSVWTYEYRRALATSDTSNDVQFVTPGGPYYFGISNSDNAGGGTGHDTSGILKLMFDVVPTSDATAPVVSNVMPSGTVLGDSTTVTADLTDGETGSGLNLATATATLDGTPLVGCTTTPISAPSNSTISCPVTGLTSGPHTISVSVTDNNSNTGTGTGGFTASSIGDRLYYTPWYDCRIADGFRSWITMANTSGSSVTAEILIHGVSKDTVTIPAGQDLEMKYDNESNGPVVVRIPDGLTSGDALTVSERTLYNQSFNETFFQDASTAGSAFAWPFYDNNASWGMMGDWIELVNVESSGDAIVDVTINGTLATTQTVSPGTVSTFQMDPSMYGGPVVVRAWTDAGRTNPKNIVAGQRVLYYNSFNEVFGNPIV